MASKTQLQKLLQKLLNGPLSNGEIKQLKALLPAAQDPSYVGSPTFVSSTPVLDNRSPSFNGVTNPTLSNNHKLKHEVSVIETRAQITVTNDDNDDNDAGASLTTHEAKLTRAILIQEINAGKIQPSKEFLDDLLKVPANNNRMSTSSSPVVQPTNSLVTIKNKIKEKEAVLNDIDKASRELSLKNWLNNYPNVMSGLMHFPKVMAYLIGYLYLQADTAQEERKNNFIIKQLLEEKYRKVKESYPELTQKVITSLEKAEQADAEQRKKRQKVLVDTIDAWRAAHIARLGLSRALRLHTTIYDFNAAPILDAPWFEGGDYADDKSSWYDENSGSWHPDLEASLFIASMMYVPIAIAAMFVDPKTQYERDKRFFIFWDAVIWSLINLVRFGNNQTAVSFAQILSFTARQSTYILLGGYLFDLFNQWYFDCKNLWDQQKTLEVVKSHTGKLTTLNALLISNDTLAKINNILTDDPLTIDDRVVDDNIKAITKELNERKSAVKNRILRALLTRLESNGQQIESMNNDGAILQALMNNNNLTGLEADIKEYQQLVALEIINYQLSEIDLNEKIGIFYKRSLLWNIFYALGLSSGASLEIMFIVFATATGPLGFAIIAGMTAINQMKNAYYEYQTFIKFEIKCDDNLDYLKEAGKYTQNDGFKTKALAAAQGGPDAQQAFNIDLINRGMKPICFNQVIDKIIEDYLITRGVAHFFDGSSTNTLDLAWFKERARSAANSTQELISLNTVLRDKGISIPLSFNQKDYAAIIDQYVSTETIAIEKQFTDARSKMRSNMIWYTFVVVSMALLVVSPGHLAAVALFVVCLALYTAYKTYQYFNNSETTQEKTINNLQQSIDHTKAKIITSPQMHRNSSNQAGSSNNNLGSSSTAADIYNRGGTFSPNSLARHRYGVSTIATKEDD